METETIGIMKQSRQPWLLCIFYGGICIYSGGETGHNEILTFEVKFDLEGQGQSPPKAIGI